jgi:hypothetical protein
MRIPRVQDHHRGHRRPVIMAAGLATFTLARAGPAVVGQPVTQALTPPPSFETCKTPGNGPI